MPSPLSRRRFLSAASGVALAAPLTAFRARATRGAVGPALTMATGRFAPAADGATGLRLLRCPEGFRYVSFGWRGDRLDDGRLTPGAHDGMAAFAAPGGRIRLIRNHEIDGDLGAFGAAPTLRRSAGGGTTTVEFDLAHGRRREGVGQPVWHLAQLRGRAHAVGRVADLRGDAGRAAACQPVQPAPRLRIRSAFSRRAPRRRRSRAWAGSCTRP